jgi:hypothetical protein
MTQSVTADTNKILTSNDNKKCLRKEEKRKTNDIARQEKFRLRNHTSS